MLEKTRILIKKLKYPPNANRRISEVKGHIINMDGAFQLQLFCSSENDYIQIKLEDNTTIWISLSISCESYKNFNDNENYIILDKLSDKHIPKKSNLKKIWEATPYLPIFSEDSNLVIVNDTTKYYIYKKKYLSEKSKNSKSNKKDIIFKGSVKNSTRKMFVNYMSNIFVEINQKIKLFSKNKKFQYVYVKDWYEINLLEVLYTLNELKYK